MNTYYEPREAVRDHNGNVFSMEHLDPPQPLEEANFTRISDAELNAALDAAHAARALETQDVPAGQQGTDARCAVANRNWAIAAKRAQAFWEARRDHFYLVHLGKAYPGMVRPVTKPGLRGQIRMNPHEHGGPAYRLRSEALQHAEHWLARNMAAILAQAPAPLPPTKAQIVAAKEKIIDRLVAEELRKKGFGA